MLDVTISSRASNATDWTEVKRLELTGFHDATTSISYSEQVDLGSSLQVGNDVQVTFTLVQGEQFQINGLALCHSLQPLEEIK